MSIKPIKPSDKTEVIDVSANAGTAPITETVDTSKQPLSVDQLLTLIAGMQQQLLASQQQAARSNELLAAAIIESGKPKQPLKTAKELAFEANEKAFEEQAKELRKRQRENSQLEQENCDHIAGSRGETKDVHQRTSIVWHRTDAQVDIGVCTGCGRKFHPEDPADSQGHSYAYWRKKGSFNRISTAGIRQFFNPLKAQHDSFLRDTE